MLTAEMKSNFDFFLKMHDKLLEKYNNKFVVIKDESVIAAYDEMPIAYNETIKKEAPGSFIIQKCSPGESDYTQTFHGVSFS